MWKQRKKIAEPITLEWHAKRIVRDYPLGRDCVRVYASMMARMLEPYSDRVAALIGHEALLDILIDSALRFAQRKNLDRTLVSEIDAAIRNYCNDSDIDSTVLKHPTSDTGGTYAGTGFKAWKRNNDTGKPELEAIRKVTLEERRQEKQAGKEPD